MRPPRFLELIADEARRLRALYPDLDALIVDGAIVCLAGGVIPTMSRQSALVQDPDDRSQWYVVTEETCPCPAAAICVHHVAWRLFELVLERLHREEQP